jgi:ACS family hexuronate transporter-like MFS transporter
MSICDCCVLPIFFALEIGSMWGAVAVIGPTTAAHEAVTAKHHSIPADMFPRSAVPSVAGIDGIGIALFTGYILGAFNNNHLVLFAIAGSTYLAGLIAVHLLRAVRRALLRKSRPCA